MSVTSSNDTAQELTGLVQQKGYCEHAFSIEYWKRKWEVDARIDRNANLLLPLIRSTQHHGLLPAHPRIIDIGAGAGSIVHDLRKHGYDTEGCEFSNAGRYLAQEHFGVGLKPCDLRDQSLPYHHGAFHLALSIGVMTMIPKQYLRHAFREMRRVLAPRGVLLLNLLNRSSVCNRHHITHLLLPEWHAHLVDAGFRDVTSICPPQKHGIGMKGEFCGIFQT